MFQEALTYDDVLLVPQYSDIESRSTIDLTSLLFAGKYVDTPIIASPMDTICGPEFVYKLSALGGTGILHRYNTIEEQLQMVMDIKRINQDAFFGAAIGTTGDFLERIKVLDAAGIGFVCIDVAHGHHLLVKKAIQQIRESFPKLPIMAGNVATAQGFADLQDWGANAIRVGVGSGSICSTRIQTGHGVPSVTCIQECAAVATTATLIADGGIKNSGDIVKALALGADLVMVGSLFSGTDETPGNVVDGKKLYRGMASRSAQQDWRGKSSAPEGVSTFVPCKGPLEPLFNDIVGGIRSGLSYTGARNLLELRTKVKFVRQTSAGQHESSPHILTVKL